MTINQSVKDAILKCMRFTSKSNGFLVHEMDLDTFVNSLKSLRKEGEELGADEIADYAERVAKSEEFRLNDDEAYAFGLKLELIIQVVKRCVDVDSEPA